MLTVEDLVSQLKIDFECQATDVSQKSAQQLDEDDLWFFPNWEPAPGLGLHKRRKVGEEASSSVAVVKQRGKWNKSGKNDG